MDKLITRTRQTFFAIPRFGKVLLLFLLVAIGYLVYSKYHASQIQSPQYQTSTAEKATLVVSISSSGQVSSTNSSSVTTDATGVITNVYVKDGDQVKTGDKIADVDLDLSGQQTVAQAWSSYQSAKNNLDSAKANLYSLQSAMFTQWKDHYDLATNSTYQNADGTPNTDNRALADFNISQDDWLSAEAKYKNQQNVVGQAQTALSSAWLTYQQSSATIYAPISGTISGLSIRAGSVVSSSQNNSSSNSSTSGGNKVANVTTSATPMVSVNLTEVDVPKVKVGNRASIIFDAFPDIMYTGKVMSIDTVGSTSSGVTSYPVVIQLDSGADSILPNMGATVTIIAETKDNVLLVPSSSVQTQTDGSGSYVRVLKNNQVNQVNVQTGLSSGTQTEITSGLSEGDVVVTSIISNTTGNTQQRTQSVFGGFGGGMRMAR